MSEKEKVISLEKNVEIIWNPFSVDINNKKILGKLYHELEEISLEDNYDEINELNIKVIQYLDHINMKVPYPIQFQVDLNLLELFKMYGVKVETEGNSVFGNIIEYMKILSTLCSVHIIFFINLKNYLSRDQLNELYKNAFYYKIDLLLIEAHQGKPLNYEKNQLIDEDLCLISY